ncbi:MAG: Alpha-amylase A type-3 [Geoglossum simile]|nr:MAG: Alpha-amylase A type-3 [Geoglossum simile]
MGFDAVCSPSLRAGSFPSASPISGLTAANASWDSQIWISPVVSQISQSTHWGQAYHGYWAHDIFALNEHFGTSDDLRALSAALHQRGMYLMVDVVTNHLGYLGAPETIDYSQFAWPFDSAGSFHPYCLIGNFDNQTEVEQCWLGDGNVPLPDIKTELPTTQSIFQNWISDLVANYSSFDGLRIDTVKHVQKEFWRKFNDAAGVFCLGEVYHGSPDYTCDYQSHLDGLLNFPMYHALLRAFESPGGNMGELVHMMKEIESNCGDPSLLGTFSENHDLPRFAHYTSDMALAKNVIAFTILADGIPIIYQGQEHHFDGSSDPANREALWPTSPAQPDAQRSALLSPFGTSDAKGRGAIRIVE